MASLWLTGVPDEAAERPLRTLKAIREALRAFAPDAGLEAAEAILDDFQQLGLAHLGDYPADWTGYDRREVRHALTEAGCETGIDIDPEVYQDRQRARAMTAEGATPEEVFRKVAPGESAPPRPDGVQPGEPAYKTAMVLMANLEGNPLKAASVAVGLARTTGAVSFYTEVVASMVLTFPWLEEMLRAQKLVA